MRNAKSLIGMSVVGNSDGTQLGTVRDLIFDLEANQVMALVLNDKDLFGLIHANIIPWDEVRSIGKEVVLVVGSSSKVPLKDSAKLVRLAQTRRDTMLSGTEVMTSDGQKIGTLADMTIDETTGQVAGYEISEGFLADTLHGKQFLPGSTDLSVGQDVAIIPPSALADLQKV